jgi:hypothetical protein
VAEKSNNSNTADDANQGRLFSLVLDPKRVRAWLVERIAEHALELVKKLQQEDEDVASAPQG